VRLVEANTRPATVHGDILRWRSLLVPTRVTACTQLELLLFPAPELLDLAARLVSSVPWQHLMPPASRSLEMHLGKSDAISVQISADLSFDNDPTRVGRLPEQPYRDTLSLENGMLPEQPYRDTLSLENGMLPERPYRDTFSLQNGRLPEQPYSDTFSLENSRLAEQPYRDTFILGENDKK
jgi:hypothetical protein